MRLAHLFLLFVFSLMVSCGGGSNSDLGLLNVFVESELGTPIKNAVVNLSPGDLSGTTNENGLHVFIDIPANLYIVEANDAGLSSKAEIELTAGGSRSITLSLVEPNEAPIINVLNPDNNSNHILLNEIPINVQIEDDKGVGNLEVHFESSLDGEIGRSQTNTNGEASIVFIPETIGISQIIITTVDRNGFEGSTTLDLNVFESIEAVNLESLVSTYGGNSLTWEASQIDNFNNYEVLRAIKGEDIYTSIISISDQFTTQHIDNSVSYGVEYSYKIKVVDQQDFFSESNVESVIFQFETIDLGSYGISKMFPHTYDDIIYALDPQQQVLLLINPKTKSLIKETQLTDNPIDMAINRSGSKLYIALLNAPKVAEVDAYTGNIIRTIDLQDNLFDIGNYPYRIGCNNDANHFVVATEEGSVRYIQVSNGSTAAIFSSCCNANGILTHRTSPDLYFTNSGTSGSETYRFVRNPSSFNVIPLDKSEGYPNYFQRDFAISGDGRFIFYTNVKLDASDLSKELGDFSNFTCSDFILAANYDGSLAASECILFDANSFQEIKELPFTSEDKFFDDENNLLFMWDAAVSKIIMMPY